MFNPYFKSLFSFFNIRQAVDCGVEVVLEVRREQLLDLSSSLGSSSVPLPVEQLVSVLHL